MTRAVRSTAVIVVSLAVALVFLVLSVAPPNADGDPSSRAAGKAGTLALYDWLQRLGFSTHRISGDFGTGGTDVLLVIEPTVAFSGADVNAVMSFMSHGGEVVVAASAARAPLLQPLLAALHVSGGAAVDAGQATPAQPFDASDRVHGVRFGPARAIEPTGPGGVAVTPLLLRGGHTVAAAEAVPGGGRAFLLASPLPLGNDGLRHPDSAGLVLSMLGRARGGAIGFDEFHHGEQAGAATGAGAIFTGPVGLALMLAAVGTVAYLALSGRRLGPPLAASDDGTVPTIATYVGAMTGLYARSSDRSAVADRFADELKQRLGAQVGVEPTSDDAAFVAALRRHGPAAAEGAHELLGRARRLAGGRPTPRQLLALARDVDELERHWSDPGAPVRPPQSAP